MKLTKILESILRELNIPKPEDAYKFDSVKSKDLGYGVYYTYIYTNVKGDKMEITVLLSNARNSTTPGPILYAAFGKYNPNKDQDEEESEESEEEEEKKYKEKTGANDMLKVMATAVEAIKQTANKIGGMNNVYAISFSPSDKKRKNIYHHYIETLFPNFDKQTEKSYQFSFTKFVNKNFKPKKELTEIGDLSAGSFPFTSKASAIRTMVGKKLIPRFEQAIEWNKEMYQRLKRPWEFDPKGGGIRFEAKTSYLVTGESGNNYNIKITYDVINKPKDNNDYSSEARVDFNLKGATTDLQKTRSTNANEQYKLVSTVVAAFIDFANAIEPLAPLTSIEIYPVADKGEKVNSVLDSKRAKLYRIYINKNLDKLPGDWTLEEGKKQLVLKRK